MSTYGEMQTEVLEHQLNDTKYRPSTKRWLNEAQNRIARQAQIPSLYTVTNLPWSAGHNHAALPADFARGVEIADATDDDNWRVLGPMELRDFDELSDVEGLPVSHIIIGDDLYLYPTPNVTSLIALSYYHLPDEMTDDADEPEIPSDYHYLLPYWALYRCFSRENDIEQATYWKNEWLTELEKLKGEAHYVGQDFPKQLPGNYETGPMFSGDQWY